ncbi:MAG: amino acid permease [Ignavibacteriae bacterium]|nr:amino acid permease [Ignavibacteria bacterium]MBI3364265.1 amino acid permease [Ignavibacteriota bacterium]
MKQQLTGSSPSGTQQPVSLARRLGLFDATMIVMGGIIGSGIFMNPHVVAQYVHTPWLILGAWVAGGVIALLGAFIYAELAARRPEVGGQYAYIREAYSPILAFLFGWTLFLVSDCGGMAAVAITFGRYFIELTGIPLSDTVVAIGALTMLTVINCLGVRTGSTVQNIFMVIKIVAVLALIGCGYFFIHHNQFRASAPVAETHSPFDLLTSFGAAMVPVLFAYGGWQTANFVAGEIREPQKNLPRGLLFGVIGVVALYVGVNVVSIRALGADGLAVTKTPASEVMYMAFGKTGSLLIAVGIAISTLGFLSQSILTAPRVYFAMAKDGLFFKSVAWLHPKTRVPVVAIALQGLLAIAITLSGTYEEILSYVVSNDFIFFGFTASCIFVLRRRSSHVNPDEERFNMPGHPVTTVLFIAVCCFIVINTIYKYPVNTLIGIGIVITGIPIYYFWRWWRRKG